MQDHTIETLKEIGLKVTPQRQAILRLLEGNRSHPSADAIFREGVSYYKEAAKAEYDQGTAQSAIEAFTDFITLFPDDKRVPQAQKALYHRAECNWAARRGEYSAAMEA